MNKRTRPTGAQLAGLIIIVLFAWMYVASTEWGQALYAFSYGLVPILPPVLIFLALYLIAQKGSKKREHEDESKMQEHMAHDENHMASGSLADESTKGSSD